MDLGPLLLLGAMWLVVNAIRKAGSAPPAGKRPPAAPPPTAKSSGLPGARSPATRAPARLPADATRVGPPASADPTQREGVRLEELLRQLGRTLEDAGGPAGRRPDRALPSAEEQEETESLEVAPVVRSLETDPARPSRALVDQDDDAERVVALRRRAAEVHGAPHTRADHQVFDARIRQEVADKTATRAPTLRQLRDAVVWREILGAPVSLRGEEER